ncbi:hypothetical protein L1049_015447 [Liquidambar formosana]|uniref:TF-B3 domain-containing protein n=1 Tax=Liquidambar formosana TaxID=63359 RepID=A0AAP0RYW0_LIQFO
MVVESEIQIYPDFYKVYVPDHSSQRLHIPQAFIAHLNGKRLPEETILRSRHGRTLWHIEVSQVEEGVFFQNGWRSFVTDNSLELGDLLTFRFDGVGAFYVTVFGKSNCEKEEIRANNASIGDKVSRINKEEGDPIEVERYVRDKNPYFVTKMKHRTRARLYVPVEVLRDHNIKLNRNMMILRDPDGKNWLGKVASWKDGRMWIGGWKAFCKWNNVGEDDRCICEFVRGREGKKVSIIQVHIVRARQEARRHKEMDNVKAII